MATIKHKAGRTGARKRTKKAAWIESVPTSTPVPRTDPALGAPKLDATLDLAEVRVKGPQAEQAAASLQPEHTEARPAGQAGSLQGLSDSAEAASESVDELLEEGNSFEAEVVKGVEDAPDADQGEIKTHEVLEDDVPEEYLDGEK